MTHPYPQYHLIADETLPDNDDFGPQNDEPTPRRYAPGELNPVLSMRSDKVPEPVNLRTPAVIHYPKDRDVIILQSGTNINEQKLGFNCRSIVVQNVGTNGFIWCPELNMYLTSGTTPLVTINLPSAIEKISLVWHTAAFNNVAPAGVAGQFAIVWLYDEWVLPDTAASGGGAASASVPTAANAAQSNVGQNVASVSLIAANTSRKGLSIFNDTTANLYISFSGAASTANFKVKVAAGGYYEMAPEVIFTGQIFGIWDAAGAGNARVTEES